MSDIKEEKNIQEEVHKEAEKIETSESGKKKKSPWFWIIMVLVILLVLGLCCCGGPALLIPSLLKNEGFREDFVDGYCSELRDTGSLSDDPFDLCDEYYEIYDY